MGRTGNYRKYVPLSGEDVQARDLQKAHREIVTLRERNASLEHALRQVYAAVAPIASSKPAPVRRPIGSSASGEQIFDDDTTERKSEISRPRRKSKFVSPHLPRPDDDQVGEWTEAERLRMDERFKRAMLKSGR